MWPFPKWKSVRPDDSPETDAYIQAHGLSACEAAAYRWRVAAERDGLTVAYISYVDTEDKYRRGHIACMVCYPNGGYLVVEPQTGRRIRNRWLDRYDGVTFHAKIRGSAE